MRRMREGLRLTTPTRWLRMRRAVLAGLVTIASGCRPAALLPAPIDASAEDVPGDVALADVTTSDQVDVVDAGSVDVPTADAPTVVDVGTDAGIDPLTVGLIAHYAFDGNANDSSGTGAPGGVVAGAALDADRCGRASSTYGFNGSRPTNDNVWHSIVATYDGTIARLYVDGTPDGTETRMLITMGQSLFVGRAVPGNPTDEYFVGTIDDVRVYDRALPPGEVASLAARGPCTP